LHFKKSKQKQNRQIINIQLSNFSFAIYNDFFV